MYTVDRLKYRDRLTPLIQLMLPACMALGVLGIVNDTSLCRQRITSSLGGYLQSGPIKPLQLSCGPLVGRSVWPMVQQVGHRHGGDLTLNLDKYKQIGERITR